MNIEERQKHAVKMLNGARDTFMVVAPKMRREFVQTELDEEHLDFTLDNIPFSITWSEVSLPSIKGLVPVVQFHLCVWYTTWGSRYCPPEEIDKELIVSRYIHDCIKKAFQTVHDSDFSHVMEGYNATSIME